MFSSDGIKDASDKKILVDMLIWAIDNPPPANYLLISGDRDFSNALHKLVMRRYNILLAQPPNVSQALTAAAKHVWLWKSLVAGEPPLAESPYISSIANGNVDHSDALKNMLSDSSDATPHNSTQVPNSIPFDQQKGGNGKGEKQYKVRQPRKNQSDNVSKPTRTEENSVGGVSDSSKGSAASQPNQSHMPSSSSSLPSSDSQDGTQVDQLNTPKIQPFSPSKKPAKSALSHQKSAPHDFYHGKKPGVSTASSSKNGTSDVNSHGHPKYQKPQSSQQPRPQNPVNHHPHGGSGNFQSSNSHRSNSCPAPAGHNGIPTAPLQSWPGGPPYGPPINYPDMSRMNISEYPRGIHNNQGLNVNYHPTNPGAPHMAQHGYSDYSYRPPTQPNIPNNMQNTGHWGANLGCPQPSSDPQGLVKYILGALEVLKTEKIPPTEQNIADCIHYGDANLPNFDVKKALQVATQHQAVVMKKLGKMSFFLGKNENLWNCVNIMDDNAKYPKETLDAVHTFISSAHGYSGIKNSQSRYQAATILKKTCLKHLALAEILQVLNIIINKKKWFVPHSSGWQPLSFNIIVADATTHASGKA
ncbi:hypothetical protein GQ55_2G449000 [Panicum hallii var. hallii]|uniref:NYN domain-containing protein n=1 Tax=Panicum hallii var. hallii TaxID=1504633 RepID=A0A2T7EZ59_9POAL|nr:hypothetical protein GQ55_2G449000 [Panicum hallii var. hallii]